MADGSLDSGFAQRADPGAVRIRGASTLLRFTVRRAAQQNQTARGRNTRRRNNPTHLGTAHPDRVAQPNRRALGRNNHTHLWNRPSVRGSSWPPPAIVDLRPPFENAKNRRTGPGCAGTLPRLHHLHRNRRLGMPLLFGRRRPARQGSDMTAAHSGTPAAVFVCQHTHSTTNLRHNQYPYPEMRKIFCRRRERTGPEADVRLNPGLCSKGGRGSDRIRPQPPGCSGSNRANCPAVREREKPPHRPRLRRDPPPPPPPASEPSLGHAAPIRAAAPGSTRVRYDRRALRNPGGGVCVSAHT